MVLPVYFVCSALLAAGELDALRELMTNSITGAALTDDVMRAATARFWAGGFASWKTEDGHCYSTFGTWLLVLRGLAALLDDDNDASSAALYEWLPPPAELLRITEYECVWRAHSIGASHPALLCARLHGERLGDWKAAEEVAHGVLAIEEFNPLLRTEALRLLGRARAELGERAASCEAADDAAAEAAGAKYAWLELMSLRDLLRWCDAGDATDVRRRLDAVAGRVVEPLPDAFGS